MKIIHSRHAAGKKSRRFVIVSRSEPANGLTFTDMCSVRTVGSISFRLEHRGRQGDGMLLSRAPRGESAGGWRRRGRGRGRIDGRATTSDSIGEKLCRGLVASIDAGQSRPGAGKSQARILTP